jgi:hypothetical protein
VQRLRRRHGVAFTGLVLAGAGLLGEVRFGFDAAHPQRVAPLRAVAVADAVGTLVPEVRPRADHELVHPVVLAAPEQYERRVPCGVEHRLGRSPRQPQFVRLLDRRARLVEPTPRRVQQRPAAARAAEVGADGIECIDLAQRLLHLVEATQLPQRLGRVETEEAALRAVEAVATRVGGAVELDRQRVLHAPGALEQPCFVHRGAREVFP